MIMPHVVSNVKNSYIAGGNFFFPSGLSLGFSVCTINTPFLAAVKLLLLLFAAAVFVGWDREKLKLRVERGRERHL